MNLHEIVMRLIGPVQPVGDSRIDLIRLRNMKDLTELIECLVDEVNEATIFASRPEASMKLIVMHAREFLKDLKEA